MDGFYTFERGKVLVPTEYGDWCREYAWDHLYEDPKPSFQAPIPEIVEFLDSQIAMGKE